VIRVTVPASTANLGPGFDALGMALSLPFELAVTKRRLDGFRPAEPTHPAAVAFARLGGSGALWWRSPIPPGRGLGYSGAARVAGLLAAALQVGAADVDGDVLSLAAELEGHPDNVAASYLGGVVAAAGGCYVRVPLALELAVVVWVPPFETRTDHSRMKLPSGVSFADAVFNVGRTAVLVAALAAGDVGALRVATEDRLHQDVRLASAPRSRAALEAALRAGACGAWLSGSGPSVAALCAPDEVQRLSAALPTDGRVLQLSVSAEGASRLE
jgi:homoserine kinase